MSGRLTTMYAELVRNARRTGEDRAVALTGGARVAVRVRGGRIVCSIARKDKPVGATEIETFRRLFGIPPEAERRPATGQETITRKREAFSELDGFAAEVAEPYHRIAFVYPDPEAADGTL